MMDGSVMGAAVVVTSSAVRMLELERPLHYQQHQQNQQVFRQSHQQQLVHHHHLQEMGALSVGHHEGMSLDNDQSMGVLEYKWTPKSSLMYIKGKPTTSEEDEPSFTEDGTSSHLSEGKSKENSPWQRMKWTNAMARLLITAVLYVGEDFGPDCIDGNKRKSRILQKKGKWKYVSRVMMDKGVSVSPQQCEDKFNDLNKRYKRLNDILGKGITCKVVENPSLLDIMPQLSAKTKDDVRKFLSSKQLLYREMCAYHNGGRMHTSLGLGSQVWMQSSITAKSRESLESCGLMTEGNGLGEEDDEENEDNLYDDAAEDSDDNGEDAEVQGIGAFGKKNRTSKVFEEVNYWTGSTSSDCAKLNSSHNPNVEMMGMLQDTNKIPWEQREWVRSRTLQLQEQKLSMQVEAFEFEKQRFKWQKFCSKEDRELNRFKLENERMKLENERMGLQVKRKELEIEFKKLEASVTSVAPLLERFHRRDHDELVREQCFQ